MKIASSQLNKIYPLDAMSYLLYSFFMIAIMSLCFACGQSAFDSSKYTGTWKEENTSSSEIAIGDLKIHATGNKIIEITNQGGNYLVRNKNGDSEIEGIYSLTKENSLHGLNGRVTMMYDNKTKKLLISFLDEPIVHWVKIEND